MALPERRTVGTVITSATREAVLDATLSDGMQQDIEWTSHPIEDGSEIQDHGTKKQRAYTLTGVISRTTLGPVLATNDLRLETIRDTIANMATDRQPVQVINGLWVLESYVISSVGFARSAGSGHSIEVSIGLVELVTTASQTTLIPPALVIDDQAPGLTSLEFGGSETPGDSDGTDTKTEVKASIAKNGYDFLSGR